MVEESRTITSKNIFALWKWYSRFIIRVGVFIISTDYVSIV